MEKITSKENSVNKYIGKLIIYSILASVFMILYFPISKQLLNIVLGEKINVEDGRILLIGLIYSIATLVSLIKLFQYTYKSAKLLNKKRPALYPIISLIIPFIWIFIAVKLIIDLRKVGRQI